VGFFEDDHLEVRSDESSDAQFSEWGAC